MTSKKRKSSWFVTAPVAAAAVLLVWYVFLPKQKQIAALREELHAKRSFAIGLAKFTGDARAVSAEMDQTRDYMARAAGALVTPSEIPRLYAEIAAVAKEAGVETTRFSPDPPVNMARLIRFPVNLGCEGTLDGIGALVEGLERLPYRIWIERVSVEADEAKSSLLRCELILEVFANKIDISG